MREENHWLKVAISCVASLLLFLCICAIYAFGERQGYCEGYKYGVDDGKKIGFQTTIQKAQTPPNYLLHDPTFKEVIQFFAEDKTNQKRPLPNDRLYICVHFARDTVWNAQNKGIRSAFVLLLGEERDHALVAFDTVDRGLVYFEPQADIQVFPVKGEEFGKGRYKPDFGKVIDIIISY